MVRVGGGWDTLEHYLDKHDPCRCSSAGQWPGGQGQRGRGCALSLRLCPSRVTCPPPRSSHSPPPAPAQDPHFLPPESVTCPQPPPRQPHPRQRAPGLPAGGDSAEFTKHKGGARAPGQVRRRPAGTRAEWPCGGGGASVPRAGRTQ
jgi:hypothetical protein